MTVRERQKLDPRFVSFSVCTLFSNKRCQRQTGVFTMFHFVQSFVARYCKMQCVCAAQNNLERLLILSRL